MTKTKMSKTLVLFVIGLVMFSNIAFARSNDIDEPRSEESRAELANLVDVEITTDSNMAKDTEDVPDVATAQLGVVSNSIMTMSIDSSEESSQNPNLNQNSINEMFKIDGKYESNLFTGSASYSYSIQVPTGVNAVQPRITLSYNHHSTNSISDMLGTGWSLNTNYIERDINYTRDSISDDFFKLRMGGVSSKLVYDASEDKYHTKQESYISIEKVSGAPNTNGDYWVVKTKDGTRYKFGHNIASELVSNTESYTSKWSLDSVTDTHGNEIVYNYIENPSPEIGTVYLDSITYNNGTNEIIFEYSDPSFSPRSTIFYQGYEIQRSSMLERILVKHNDELVRKYEMEYTYAPTLESPTTTKKFLWKINEFGSDGSSLASTTTFNYNPIESGWETDGNWVVPWEDVMYFGSNKDEGVRFMDIEGNGPVDIIKAKSTATINLIENEGEGWSDDFSTGFDLVPGGFVDEHNRDRGVRLVDVNGDGKTDLLQSLSGDATIQLLKINTGTNTFIEQPHNLPAGLSFVWSVAPDICSPASCAEGWTDEGITCNNDNYCERECSLSYRICGNSWTEVFDDSGDGYDNDNEEEYDSTANYHASSTTNCYKYFVDTPNYVDIGINGDDCYVDEDEDGDSVFIAGLEGDYSDNSWLSTVPPLNSQEGWYGVLPDPFNGADFRRSYLLAHQFSSNDFDSGDSDAFEDDDEYIYCAPNEASCAFSNLDRPCGYGCYQEGTEAYVQSGYYWDPGNDFGWLEIIALDDECDEEVVNENDAEDIRLVVYTTTSTPQTDSYTNYCNRAITHNDLGVRLTDINGDGKVDILEGKHNSRRTWINTGDGFVEDADWMIPTDAYFITSDNKDRGIRIADINADGLVDIIKGTISGKNIWLNNGNGWVERNTFVIPSGSEFIDNNNIPRPVVLADVNGDGFVDILKSDGLTTQTWLNNNGGWGSINTWDPPTGVNFSSYGSKIADVNSDGLPDLVKAKDSSDRETWIKSGSKAYLLSSVENKFGGTITIDYKRIPLLDNTGIDSVSDLGFSGWVVDSVTYHNGISGSHNVTATTTYDYADGYFDPDEREFRGFNYAKEILPDGTIREHWYNQGDDLASLEYETKIKDSGENLLQKIEYGWSSENNNGYYSINLNEMTTHLFNGENSKTTTIEYQYDDYGNLVTTSYLGDIFITGDERYQVAEYVYNTDLWIMDKPKRTYLYGYDGIIIRDRIFYYDDQAYGGSPIHGDITQISELYSAGTNPTTYYTYDDYGNIITETDPNEHTTTLGYDATNTYVSAVTNYLGHTTTTEYDAGTGNKLSITDPNGYVINYEYDVFGRKIKDILPNDDESFPTKTYEYTIDGSAPEKVKIMQREDTGWVETYDTLYFYDGFGNLIQTKKEAINSNRVVVNTYYDNLFRKHMQSDPFIAITDQNYDPESYDVGNITYSYDKLNRVVNIENQDSSSKQFVYDLWIIQNYDENNDRKDYIKDAHNNIVGVKEYNGDEIYTTSYEFNADNQLVSIIDNQGNEITYVYDTLGRKTNLFDPDIGTLEYEYDSAGNLITQTDNENVVSMEYDDLNRLTRKTSGDAEITYEYDNETIGELYRVITPDMIVNYEYDERLRKTRETKEIDGMLFVTEWTYDSLSRIITKMLPNNEIINYNYNNAGALVSVSEVVDNIYYNEMMQPTNIYYSNSLNTLKEYDSLHHLSNITTNNLQDLHFEYDGIGNVVQIVDNEKNLIQDFQYDDLNRLIFAGSYGVNETNYTADYSYDSIGNLLNVVLPFNNLTFLYGEDSPVHAPSEVMATTNNLNNAPFLETINNITIDETELIIIEANASDPDNDELFYSINDSRFTQADNMFSWQTDYEDEGYYDVAVTISDGEYNSSQELTITINNLNRAPELSPIEDIIINETDVVTIITTGTDPDNDSLTYSINDSRFNQTDNIFTWQTDYEGEGSYVFTITISDGYLNNSQEVEVTVLNLNRAPE
ncbi:VCBS repeat-containing protein, partial [Candidatus Woesearchaeota archaeon]|nr:VCBS repeat-containing protein [Candidatus Woesearchaeota archaeon]